MYLMKYKDHTIELETDGSYSVYHPIYHYRTNRKSIEECQKYIDWAEVEAANRVALTMAYTMVR